MTRDVVRADNRSVDFTARHHEGLPPHVRLMPVTVRGQVWAKYFLPARAKSGWSGAYNLMVGQYREALKEMAEDGLVCQNST